MPELGEALNFLRTRVKNEELRELLAAVASGDLMWLEESGRSLIDSEAIPENALEPLRNELQRLSLAPYLVLLVCTVKAINGMHYWLRLSWQVEPGRWVQLQVARRWPEEKAPVAYAGDSSGLVEIEPGEALDIIRKHFLWLIEGQRGG